MCARDKLSNFGSRYRFYHEISNGNCFTVTPLRVAHTKTVEGVTVIMKEIVVQLLESGAIHFAIGE